MRKVGYVALLVASLALEGASAASDEFGLSERVVTQGEWAADLVEALGLGSALPEDASAEDLFSLLCPDRAERVVQEGGRSVPGRSALRVAVEAPRRRAPTDPLRVVLSVPATALYQLSVEGVGAQRWSVDRRPVGHLDASDLGVGYAPTVVPLRRGPHEISGVVTASARVDRIELTAFRQLCIAPAEGWRPDRPLTFAGKARTLVRAMGLERRLPRDGDPIAIEGEQYASATAWGGRTNRRLGSAPSEGAWATAVGSPAEFAYRTHLDEPGIFTVLARLHGSPAQIWSVDGRYRATVRPQRAGGDFAWTHVMTLPLGSGEHVLRGLVSRGAGIDLLRLERRRARDGDYLAVLEELGFAEGAPSAYVTRAAADANLSHPTFLERTRGFPGQLVQGGDPLLLVEDELEDLYSRPLSPLLPSEL